MSDNNVNNIKNKPIVQQDNLTGQTITFYPNGNGVPMISIDPKQINTVSEENNGE
jgi:hypothetical protein